MHVFTHLCVKSKDANAFSIFVHRRQEPIYTIYNIDVVKTHIIRKERILSLNRSLCLLLLLLPFC